MYSILVTVAFFTAVIVNDVFLQDTEEIPKHALLGLISTGIISTLWFYDLELVAWGLLILPITALTISFLVLYTKTYGETTVALPTPVAPKPELKKNVSHRHCVRHNHDEGNKEHQHKSWHEMFQHVKPKKDSDNKYNVPRCPQIPLPTPPVYSDIKGNPNGDKRGEYVEPC